MGVCMCEPEQHEILDGPTSAQQQSCLVHRKFCLSSENCWNSTKIPIIHCTLLLYIYIHMIKRHYVKALHTQAKQESAAKIE